MFTVVCLGTGTKGVVPVSTMNQSLTWVISSSLMEDEVGVVAEEDALLLLVGRP